MKSWVNKLMMALFFISLATFLIWKAVNRPRVFVLQSYTEHYSWTKNVNSAIHNVLDAKNYAVKYHFMDTKRHSDPEFKRIAGISAQKQINDWKPDILIAVDDNAQSLVSSCYVDKSKISQSDRDNLTPNVKAILGKCINRNPDIQIIFSGIGAAPKDYGFRGQDNVTGILERMDVPALEEALLILADKIGKKNLNVYAPIDNSTSGSYNINSLIKLKQQMLSHNISINIQVIKTFSQWQKLVNDSNGDGDILLFSNYHTIKCGDKKDSKRVSPENLIQWTNNHSDIVGLGAWGFYVGNGGMLAVGVSPYEQGEVAASMAVNIIDNKIMAKDIDIETTRQSIILMRHANIAYHGLTMPRIYEAFARATGNFYSCDDEKCIKDIDKIKMNKSNSQVEICGIKQ